MGRNYSRKDKPVFSDLVLIWDSSNSDWRLTSLNQVKDLMLSSLIEDGEVQHKPITQYSNPKDGFSVKIDDTKGVDVHLILNLSSSYNVGVVILPQNIYSNDKQEIIVTSTNSITDFSLQVNEGTIRGEPNSLAANESFTLMFDKLYKTWYRIS